MSGQKNWVSRSPVVASLLRTRVMLSSAVRSENVFTHSCINVDLECLSQWLKRLSESDWSRAYLTESKQIWRNLSYLTESERTISIGFQQDFNRNSIELHKISIGFLENFRRNSIGFEQGDREAEANFNKIPYKIPRGNVWLNETELEYWTGRDWARCDLSWTSPRSNSLGNSFRKRIDSGQVALRLILLKFLKDFRETTYGFWTDPHF